MKKLIAVVLLVTLVCSLVACSVKQEDLIGTYQYKWTYQGNSYTEIIVIMPTGKYTETTYKNGRFYESASGDWEIDGREVFLYDSSSSVYHGMATIYTYSNGKLKTGKSVYTKQ